MNCPKLYWRSLLNIHLIPLNHKSLGFGIKEDSIGERGEKVHEADSFCSK
jgi:hypothetical protein